MNPTWKLQLGAALALVGISLAWMVGPGCGLAAPVRANKPYRSSHTFEVSITTKSYRGWRDAIVMSNGKVTAVIVPSIGRVLQFGFAGEEGVFWENPELGGQPALKGDWAQTEWVNLGGDKSWPAPEADWPKFTGRKSWRPPPAFDALPVSARIVGPGGFVVLTSPVDPAYGIRVERRIRLYPGRNEMTIQTIFQKLGGEPAKVGVWVITQLREPVGVFAPLPAESTLHIRSTTSSWKCGARFPSSNRVKKSNVPTPTRCCAAPSPRPRMRRGPSTNRATSVSSPLKM